MRAIYDADTAKNPGHAIMTTMFFHFKYLYEADRPARRRRAPTACRSTDPTQAPAVAKAIDALFENSDAQTKTETEAQFIAGFIALAGNLALLLNADRPGRRVHDPARHRQHDEHGGPRAPHGDRGAEDARLPSGLVMTLILGEALVIGLLGGGLGLLLGERA